MRESALKRSIGIWEGEKREPAKATQVSLIRQELVTLTGNHSRAVILNQLLYWTQRTKDFSLMVEEERNRDGTKQSSIGLMRERFKRTLCVLVLLFRKSLCGN